MIRDHSWGLDAEGGSRRSPFSNINNNNNNNNKNVVSYLWQDTNFPYLCYEKMATLYIGLWSVNLVWLPDTVQLLHYTLSSHCRVNLCVAHVSGNKRTSLGYSYSCPSSHVTFHPLPSLHSFVSLLRGYCTVTSGGSIQFLQNNSTFSYYS